MATCCLIPAARAALGPLAMAARPLALGALMALAPALAFAEEAAPAPAAAPAVAEPAPAPSVAVPQAAAAPQAAPVSLAAPALPTVEPHVDLQTMVLYRNDGDFDRTAPYYDASGQSVGALATVFRPDITWRPAKSLRLFYQAELGLNYWGKQNPDVENFASPDVFVLKHRQVYGEGELGAAGFKLGFSEFQDATGLFVHHWIGVGQARWFFAEGGVAEVFFGQVPDQVYEGVNVLQNNFNKDTFVYGATVRYAFSERLKLTVGLHDLFDAHVVGQVRRVFCPNAELEAKLGAFSGYLDLALQAGRFSGTALDGGSQDLLAWAVQGRVQVQAGPVELQLNGLALSPDGDYDGGSTTHAFLYSGKSKSATLAFTEDEIRNWYDSLDLRMAGFSDGFYTNRAGLFVADLKATWSATEAFKPALVLGAAATLNPHNSLGETFVGLEADLLLQYRLSEHFYAQGMVGTLLPGKAGAALVNAIDLTHTDPLVQAEASLLLHY